MTFCNEFRRILCVNAAVQSISRHLPSQLDATQKKSCKVKYFEYLFIADQKYTFQCEIHDFFDKIICEITIKYSDAVSLKE